MRPTGKAGAQSGEPADSDRATFVGPTVFDDLGDIVADDRADVPMDSDKLKAGDIRRPWARQIGDGTADQLSEELLEWADGLGTFAGADDLNDLFQALVSDTFVGWFN